jgi:hypothetical protein
MNGQGLSGDWERLRAALLEFWPRLTEQDLTAIAGRRDELMRTLKVRYGKSYGEIERELVEFELRDVRLANASRRSLGITD